MIDSQFPPDQKRTAALDLAVRRSLAYSVAAVLDEVACAGVLFAGDLATWRERLLAQAAPARVWACYYDLVQAVFRLDEAAIASAAGELLATLPNPWPAPPPTPGTVVSLSDEHLAPADAARYRAVIDNDPVRPLDLQSVTDAEVTRVTQLAKAARELVGQCCPALANELDTLGHEIVLATGAARSFGGAATVFLWGGIVLNPFLVQDRVTLVESLAHETAHALLFGLTLGADLTTNALDERYASPLRPDPRPIEGIVHATYVLARMNYALHQLSASPLLTQAEHDLVQSKLRHNRVRYDAGLATVDAHACFTKDGAAIFASCRRAMLDSAVTRR